jgi:hypothetical protein
MTKFNEMEASRGLQSHPDGRCASTGRLIKSTSLDDSIEQRQKRKEVNNFTQKINLHGPLGIHMSSLYIEDHYLTIERDDLHSCWE